MALADTIEDLPPWALYGGAGVVAGGGYLLYRKRKAAAATAAGAGSGPSSLSAAPVTAYDASAQQSSIVPYYLTADQNATGQGTGRQPPRTPPTSVPTPTGVSGSTLPDIPPLLNISSTGTPPPPPPVAPPPPPPPPPPQVAAPPPPAQQVANLPPDLLAKIQAGGEHIIGNLIDPVTGGTWWFGSKGGVFAVNGARFLGSARNYGFDDPNVRIAVQAVPLGSGYRIVSSRGETYNFPS